MKRQRPYLSGEILLIFLFFLSASLHAQTHRIARLKEALSRTVATQQKIPLLLALCDENNSESSDSVFAYAREIQRLAKGEKLNSNFLMGLYFEAVALQKKGKLDNALLLTDSTLRAIAHRPIFEAVRRKMQYLKGTLLIRQNHYDRALVELFNLLRVAENDNDKETRAITNSAIGWCYMEMNRPNIALQWFNRSKAFSDSSLIPSLIPTYGNLAAVHGQLGNLDSAAYYIRLSTEYSERFERLGSLCNALNLQAALFLSDNKIALAEEPLLKAVSIRRQIGDPFFIASDLAQLSSYYALANNPTLSISTAKEGLAICSRYGLTAKYAMLYSSLAEGYFAKGDLVNYRGAMIEVLNWRDSMYRRASSEAIAELSAQYDIQKKENTIILQQLQLVKRNYVMVALITILFFILISGWLLLRSRKKRELLKLQQIIEKEHVAALRAVKEAEEKERRRIAADLHDNLGAYAASIAYNAERFHPDPQENTALLQELKSGAQRMVSELSDTIWALKKNALQLTAISDRTKVFIQNLQRTYQHVHIEVQEFIESDAALPPAQAFHLLRIIQEAINNCLRHSECSTVEVVFYSADNWFVTVKDNGKGFDADTALQGNGLSNMRQRASACGWQINWRSNAAGTEIIVHSTTY